jgi:iron(III) transport system ATP-binding protein
MSAGLAISGLAKSFGATPVLHDVSFTVAPGSLTAILGASGSGKTTLLRLIAGFEAPDAGEISLAGVRLASGPKIQPPERRAIGYVAQEGALFPHLNVADNITFGLSRAERRTRHRVPELLRLLDLPASYADRAPQELSGGQQQRVALARALAPNPKLVLLDEPFSALDAGLRAETRQAVAAALQAAGATAILVTHDQEEALSLGAQVGVLQAGVLAQMSPPERLYRQPASAGLAHFLGEAVFLPGLAAAGRVDCALGLLTLAERDVRGAVQVMVRPEQIRLFDEARDGRVAARVRNVRFFGHDALVRLAVHDGGLDRDVTARLFSQFLPQQDSQVWLQVDGEVAAFASSAPSAISAFQGG